MSDPTERPNEVTPEDPAMDAPKGMSRRGFVRRVAIVGGTATAATAAAWSIPGIRSVALAAGNGPNGDRPRKGPAANGVEPAVDPGSAAPGSSTTTTAVSNETSTTIHDNGSTTTTTIHDNGSTTTTTTSSTSTTTSTTIGPLGSTTSVPSTPTTHGGSSTPTTAKSNGNISGGPSGGVNSGGGSGGGGGRGPLAFTGSDSKNLAIWGVVAVVGGRLIYGFKQWMDKPHTESEGD